LVAPNVSVKSTPRLVSSVIKFALVFLPGKILELVALGQMQKDAIAVKLFFNPKRLPIHQFSGVARQHFFRIH
jgi:hypothetical protein